MIFIYVALLFSVVSVVDIVSPARVEEQSALLFIAVVCAIVVITPPFLVPAFLQHLRTVPDYALEAGGTESSLAPIILNLRIRSRLLCLGHGHASRDYSSASRILFRFRHQRLAMTPTDALNLIEAADLTSTQLKLYHQKERVKLGQRLENELLDQRPDPDS